MIKKIINFMHSLRDRQRINIAISKGIASASLRNIDETRPETWEFSGFSQNGEDGILQFLRSRLKGKNHYFLEIGAADGIDNNSAWPTIVEKHAGIMIEGSPSLVERARRIVGHYSLGLEIKQLFVDLTTVKDIYESLLHKNPDLFSLDIDGNDYHIAKAIFEMGFRPKITIVEYNSTFGPKKSLTIPYKADFVYTDAHSSEIYFGVSVNGWKNFFSSYGYKFVTVDRKGVNAIFVDPQCFDKDFLDNIKSLEFAENELQLRKFRVPYTEQFKMIENMPYFEVPSND